MRPFVAVFAVLAFLLAGCREAAPDDSGALVLRIYDVPKGTARPLMATLKDAFWMGDKNQNVGRSAVTPDGKLAVLATPGVQSGVETLVEEATKHPLVVEQTIELRYWVLLGRPAASPQPLPPGLKEVEPALAEIQRTLGPQSFTVAEHVRLSSINDSDGRVDSGDLHVDQKAAQVSERVYAQIGIHYAKGEAIDTRVRLEPDRI